MSSAGGLSYSGIVGYGKVTLPSVESWGTNMNILQDPPKSIVTRRIDRVGETSSITSMQDESGNRVCEAISVYPRGVNPMVGVMYSNHKTTGLPSGSATANDRCTVPAASMPYKILEGGVFRPPMEYGMPARLMPLSRLPRLNTSVSTQPGFVNYVNRPAPKYTTDNSRYIRPDLSTRPTVRPTATYKKETVPNGTGGLQVQVKAVNPTSATFGTGHMDGTMLKSPEAVSQVTIAPLHANTEMSCGFIQGPSNNSTMNTDPYVNAETIGAEIPIRAIRPDGGCDGTLTLDEAPFVRDMLEVSGSANPTTSYRIQGETNFDAGPFTQTQLNVAGTTNIKGTKESMEVSLNQEPFIQNPLNVSTQARHTSRFTRQGETLLDDAPYIQDSLSVEAFSNPDGAKRIMNVNMDTSPFTQDHLHASVRPIAITEKQIHQEEKYTDPYVKDIHEISMHINPSDVREVIVQDLPTHKYTQNIITNDVRAPVGQERMDHLSTKLTDPYVQDIQVMCVEAAPGESHRGSSIENIRGLTDIHTQNAYHTNYTTPALQTDGVQMHQELPEMTRNMPDFTLHSGHRTNVEKFLQAEHGHTLVEKLPSVAHLPQPTEPTGINNNNAEQYNQLPIGLKLESFEGEQRRPNLHRVDPYGARRNSKSTSNRRAVNSGIAGRVF